MSVQLFNFAVLISQGGTAANPQVISLAGMPPAVVTGFRIRFPPGPRGEVGVSLGAAGSPVYPIGAGQYIVGNDEIVDEDLEEAIESGAWQMIAYNTGTYPHTIEVLFRLSLLGSTADTSPPPALVANTDISPAALAPAAAPEAPPIVPLTPPTEPVAAAPALVAAPAIAPAMIAAPGPATAEAVVTTPAPTPAAVPLIATDAGAAAAVAPVVPPAAAAVAAAAAAPPVVLPPATPPPPPVLYTGKVDTPPTIGPGNTITSCGTVLITSHYPGAINVVGRVVAAWPEYGTNARGQRVIVACHLPYWSAITPGGDQQGPYGVQIAGLESYGYTDRLVLNQSLGLDATASDTLYTKA